MAITFSCACGRNVVIGDEFAGQEGKCPGCGRTVTIPHRDDRFTERPGIAPSMPAVGEKKIPIWEQTPASRRPPPLPDDDDVVSDGELAPLVTHANAPLAEDDDFFAEAPKEIGRLFSVFTSLKKHHAPTPAGTRAAIAAVAFFVGCVVTAFIVSMIQGGRVRGDGVVLSLGISALVGAGLIGFVYWMTGFSHTCSYVGDDGVARFQCHGNRGNVTESGFFLFKDAAELRTSLTRHYVNGGYTGTSYSYTWSDERGNTVFTLSGRYSSQEGTPVFTDPYYFALAAESAWSLHLFRNMDRLMSRDNLLFFGLGGGNHIELGEGIFILRMSGGTVEFQADQIDKMTIENGVVSIWEHGAKQGWFSNTGIHQFNYADLGNARFFMFALEKMLGLRF